MINDQIVNTLAYGWHIFRRDGISLGFTSHDRSQDVGGIRLSAQPGLSPTRIISSLGTQSDGLDIGGALTDDALREDDLQNGRWNGAHMHIFLYDWQEPDVDIISLARGQLGEVRYSEGSFNAEFLGLAAQLDHEVAPLTSPNCRARFGDQHCKLNQQRFTHELRVSHIDGNMIFCLDDLPGNRGDFAFGELRWLSGPATGLNTFITRSEIDNLSVIDIPACISALSYDDAPLNLRIEVIMGCDKNISTCSNRFRNSVNFRGEPYLPGNDLLTRYPGLN